MTDLLAALGLVLVIEGVVLAGLPGKARSAAEQIMATPEPTLRWLGVASAVIGVMIVWLVRG